MPSEDRGEAGRDAPAVIAVEARPAAVIRIVVPRPDLPRAMRPAIAELDAALAAQGIPPAGPLFAHHVRLGDGVFDVEIGRPVGRIVAATGRVLPGGLPAATVVRAVHRGGYEGLPRAWDALRRWMEAWNHRPAADLWEVYAVGPEAAPDPAGWRTELYQPLAR